MPYAIATTTPKKTIIHPTRLINDIISFKNTIFNILEETTLPGLKENLVDSFYITPNYFEKDLNTQVGSGFGIQPIFRQSAYFRYSNKAPEFDNLYFVGASTHLSLIHI